MATKQPDDKSHFILPDLGEGVHEAELIRWTVKPGDAVAEHETIAEMETDKALVEVPSPWAGTIKALHGNEGDILIVGSKIVEYEIGGSAAGATTANGDGSAGASADAGGGEDAGSGDREDAGTVVGNVSGELSVSDRFQRKPEHLPAEDAVNDGRKPLATPAVRRVARELGVDLKRVNGTGRGGRITASDINAHASGGGAGAARVVGSSSGGGTAAMAAAPMSELPAVQVSGDGVAERIPFRGVRRKIAESLHRSVQTTVHFTAVDEADVTALDKKRREYMKVLGRKLSLLPFVMLGVCQALRKHPQLNANVDDTKGEILIKSVINLGCAVDTEHGLMVPVIHSAEQLGLVQLGDAVTQLASQCRDRSVERERLTGGTFTISNVGSYGGRFATPIINYPEVGILAVGRAREQVMTKDGMFYAGQALPLSISCDHRVVDGAEAVRFLNTLRGMLEEPETLLQ